MGRHRSGTVVGCYRKLQRWALSSILEEYRRYAGMKVRVLNEQVGSVCPTQACPLKEGRGRLTTVYRTVRYGSSTNDGADGGMTDPSRLEAFRILMFTYSR